MFDQRSERQIQSGCSLHGESGATMVELNVRTPALELYLGMTESPDLRWALIRKIYAILPVQLLISAVVADVVVKVRTIPHFFVPSNAGLRLYIFLIIFPSIVLCSLYL